MRDKILDNKTHFVAFSGIFLFLIFFYIVFYFLNQDIIEKYNHVILPSIYIDEFDMSNYSYDEFDSVLENKKNRILSRKVVFVSKGGEITTTLKEIGLVIDTEKTLSKIDSYQEKLSYPQKIWYINGHNHPKEFSFYYSIDEDVFRSFFTQLAEKAYVAPVDGHFDTSEGVRYVRGVNGFKLDYDQNKEIIEKYFSGKYEPEDMKIELVGEEVEAYTNESYATIDTMTSSFVTEYDTWVTLRAQNLRTGVGYVNGAIVEPGEVFSFFRYAGPYNKAGYVFYYEYVGNGVCQVATTVYDAALLGGHEIVARSPHKKKSVYVDGGLDATVASSNDGSWNTDMKFRNVYEYPIYIKAYDTYGEIHVEFWSNHDATHGKTYSTESVWLGGRGYRTYLHTYQDGVEISRDVITTTWYPED